LTIWVWAGHGERGDDRGFSSSGTGKTGERAGARVLVVDDDSSILDTVTSILSSEGFQVMAANGGQQALGLLNSWHPTLVLLDMRMPIMDGWAAAESAKKWADEIGAAGHLAKPFLLDELIDCVERYSRERRN
jgi:two-component system chemotaxis response regulator CheY